MLVKFWKSLKKKINWMRTMYFCTNGRIIILFVFAAIVAVTLGEQCKVVPKCTCKIGDEEVTVAEQETSSEALAGAVGALGSAMVTGGGVGVWYLVKGRSSGSDDFGSSDSSISDEEADRGKTGKGPPSYGSNKNADEEKVFTRTTNIYTAGQNDNLSHSVGKPRGVVDDF